MQQLYVTGRDSEREPTTMRDIERHVATPWDWRDGKRKPVTIGESERYDATTWYWERQ